jgi:SNF2 family DNA or RNA helicase
VQYQGATSKKEREAAVDAFQAGEVRAFIGIAAAGGTGLTLTAATTAIYYSNTLKLVERLQSEDRCHRIGTTEHVVYIDLVAVETRDEDIAAALQHKEEVAAYILGDRR